jgi:hypothetical protein
MFSGCGDCCGDEHKKNSRVAEIVAGPGKIPRVSGFGTFSSPLPLVLASYVTG